MNAADLNITTQIHAQVFPARSDGRQPLAASLSAGAEVMPFVLQLRGQVEGYVIWRRINEDGGAVLQLEQIAIHPDYQHQGLGAQLIRQSLAQVRAQLERQQSVLRHIVVTTQADRRAQRFYRRVLGAKVEATLSKLYAAGEVVMIARNTAAV